VGIFSKKEIRETVEQPVEQENANDALLEIIRGNYTITKQKAMNAPAVSACVSKISEIVSMLPIRLYKKDGDDVQEIVDDYRLRLLNKETGDTLDAAQMKKALVVDYFLGKGGYCYINKRGNKILSLHYVDEEDVAFIANEDPIFKDYKVLVNGKEYNSFDFIKLLRATKNGYDSISIIKENEIPFLLAYQTAMFEKTLLEAGGNKKGFLQADKKLSREAMQALKVAFRNLYSNKNENVVVLNDGLTFKESSNSSTELQLNENKTVNNNNICKIFNIPPSLLNGNATSNDERIFLTNCIIPLLNKFETAINRDLLLESEKDTLFFAFDISEIEKADIEKRYAAYQTAVKEGFMQIDEVRQRENLPKLGLDFIKLGLQDVLFDPEQNVVFTPNTGLSTDLDNVKVDTKNDVSSSGNPDNNITDTDNSTKGGETEDEN
jgi:HK97 family phage portal protein